MELADIGFNLTSSAFREDENEVIARANKAGVNRFILTGSNVEESRAAISFTDQYSGMYSTAGVHPHLAKNWNEHTQEQLYEISTHEKVVAIGEAGLDYNRNYSPPDQQRDAYEKQLQLACELSMPIFLHERDAHADFFAILKNYRDKLTNVVVHCFTGTEKELKNYLAIDCHIGITGWICDERRGHHLHEFIHLIPDNRLMIETDAPYLLPRDLPESFVKPKGRRNEPAYLPHILNTIARHLDKNPELVAEQTTLTTKRFFNIH